MFKDRRKKKAVMLLAGLYVMTTGISGMRKEINKYVSRHKGVIFQKRCLSHSRVHSPDEQFHLIGSPHPPSGWLDWRKHNGRNSLCLPEVDSQSL